MFIFKKFYLAAISRGLVDIAFHNLLHNPILSQIMTSVTIENLQFVPMRVAKSNLKSNPNKT